MLSNTKRKIQFLIQNTKFKNFFLLLLLGGHVFYLGIFQDKRKSEESGGGGGEEEGGAVGVEEEEEDAVELEEEEEPTVEEKIIVTRKEWKELKEEMFKSQNDSTQNPSIEEGWKDILVWSSGSSPKTSYESLFIRLTSGECEESRCKIKFGKIFATDVDAILFRANDVTNVQNKKFHLPNLRTRNSDQIYVFYTMETPNQLQINYLRAFPENFFNWTMGYRLDSDVYEPFGRVSKKDKKGEIKRVTQNELQEKKMAVWISSPCYFQLSLKIEHFLNSLSSLISVENLGKCSEESCKTVNRKKIYGRELDESNCDGEIQNYIFYLALEKPFCTDYISERIFKAWKYGAIPVVFGEANYSSIAPPNSYIDSKDFDSISKLAEYMKKVASNSSLYNQYFKWREAYEVDVGIPNKPLICDLCKKLHDQDKKRIKKSYANIYDWFVRKDVCNLLTI
ncbi:UNVERIFIED_CONTAM: hypothetical protein RMT77_015829 [Armadillidium vulgare]